MAISQSLFAWNYLIIGLLKKILPEKNIKNESSILLVTKANFHSLSNELRVSPPGVEARVLRLQHYSEFELQSHYYAHF